jgi:putative transcriptional regulator
MDNNIYKVIRDRNMTQADLAKMVGVKREYMNRIINRRITPTVPLGMRIAHALDLPMEDLFLIEQ